MAIALAQTATIALLHFVGPIGHIKMMPRKKPLLNIASDAEYRRGT